MFCWASPYPVFRIFAFSRTSVASGYWPLYTLGYWCCWGEPRFLSSALSKRGYLPQISRQAYDTADINNALWTVHFILELNRSLFNEGHPLINVLTGFIIPTDFFLNIYILLYGPWPQRNLHVVELPTCTFTAMKFITAYRYRILHWWHTSGPSSLSRLSANGSYSDLSFIHSFFFFFWKG